MPFQKGHKPYKKGEKAPKPVAVPEEVLSAQAETKIEQREEIVRKKEVAGDVTFFTELDMNDKGKINAAYPAWFDRKRIFNLEEDIRRDEASLANGWVNPASLGEFKSALAKKKEALGRVQEAKDRVEKAIGKDFVRNVAGSLGEKIGQAMPSRYDEEKGFTDPHGLAEKWNSPCITITPEERKLARMANVQVTDGQVSLVGTTMAWQMGRKFLGEDANAERLRRDR
jgi:hypothetical protein